jgi:hypothetical protein
MFVQDWWLWSVTYLRPPCWRNFSPKEWGWFSTKSFPTWLMYIFHIKKIYLRSTEIPWSNEFFTHKVILSIINHLPIHQIFCQCAQMKLCFQFLMICLQGCFQHGSEVQISRLSVSFGKHMVGNDITFWQLCHHFPFLLSVNFHLCMSHRMIHGHSLYVINKVYHLVKWGVL